MLPSNRWLVVRNKWVVSRNVDRRHLLNLPGVMLLLALVCLEFSAFNIREVDTQGYTSATVDSTCQHIRFSPDGNPFPICPGPFPVGGNCTWWAWEQWHLLGYNLPPNWGNAADWIVDAERAGLPVGTMPRVGAIAVFPRGDGVWAFGPAGHVAFVTAVSADGRTFDVTYQNYGSSVPMYVGRGYSVSVINGPRFQNGGLRFIYFPLHLDARHFARLSGIGFVNMAALTLANVLLDSSVMGDRISLGLPPISSDQEFNADFTGTGFSDLLLYNRQSGRLAALHLENTQRFGAKHVPRSAYNETSPTVGNPRLVSLGDSITPAGQWGPSLDVHIGDFEGMGRSDILLYDRLTGVIQLISLTPQLAIAKHVVLSGWGTGWELYIGRFDGQRSGVFMYNRFAQPDFVATAVAAATAAGEAATAVAQPSPTPLPTSTPKPGPTPTPKPTPKSSPTPTPHPGPTPTATPKLTPTATPTPRPSPTPTPTATRTATPTPTPKSSPTVTPSPPKDPRDPSAFSSDQPGYNNFSGGGGGGGGGGLLADWETLGRTANIRVLDFNRDFSIRFQQQYILWHGSWEVYIGRFASSQRDGIFLFDRAVGEGRIMDFDSHMAVFDYQELHNLDGNWLVYSGDFVGSGRAQLLLYDPSSGTAQILTFARNLALTNQKLYSDWGTNQVLYVGHFGTKSLNVMLYDPEVQQSTFFAFNKSLEVVHQSVVQSWDQHLQILVGAFLDRVRCLASHSCSTGDDILVLNRQTGQIQQYAFSFGEQFHEFDNRSASFERSGIASQPRVNSIDTTTFSLLATLRTSVRDEELY